ncbi:hypothetical protein CK203_089412 [Vitis vinifera]|uniref:Uncharacterized protein n=1 Tax=Vitis vinifera TaxID=29760 RepID=A0A438E951_VITVI|nr:hypothetical protein CK203_089412 [Vitis vinifera]
MTAYKVDQPEQPQPAARRASHDTYLGITVAAPAIPRAHQLHQLHLSHPLQLNRGWPFLYLNIESCVVHWRLSQLLRAVLLKRWQPLEHARADVGHSGSTHCHLKEVPLPPFNYSHSYHIEDNAQFGWGGMRKEVINFVDYSLIQGAPAGHESADTPTGHESSTVQGVETLPPDDTERAFTIQSNSIRIPQEDTRRAPLPDSLREKHTTLANNTPRTIA